MLSGQWKKSSESGDNGDSVEVRLLGGVVEVRESEEPDTVVRFTPERWRKFLAGAAAGEFDLAE